ncbi:hypothetical protein Acr_03g0018350 [Actinidia rufa]|uniref:Uncharacterized protein n=1 Tax=Actinidia rufa TaxID=165716 RepID=A0A7J0EF00_9ERIC|nr:hypothetical protein Acr_03g0018350 [Actinidia rufa]
MYWDLSSANFGSGPEPLEGYYLAVVFKGEMVLLIGDLKKEAFKKINATPSLSNAMFISKREHIFGKRVYGTKAQFCDNGPIHGLTIECDTIGINDPCLVIRVDRKMVMQVKRLRWKFRVFMFQTCSSAEKLWASQTFSNPYMPTWPCSQSFKESRLQGLGFSLILYAWKNE